MLDVRESRVVRHPIMAPSDLAHASQIAAQYLLLRSGLGFPSSLDDSLAAAL